MSETSQAYYVGFAKLLPELIYKTDEGRGRSLCLIKGVFIVFMSDPPDIRRPGNEALAWRALMAMLNQGYELYFGSGELEVVRTDRAIGLFQQAHRIDQIYAAIEALGSETKEKL